MTQTSTSTRLPVGLLLAFCCAFNAHAEQPEAPTKKTFHPDFVEGFFRSCAQGLPAAQCGCILATLEPKLSAEEVLAGGLSEETLLAAVQACAVVPKRAQTLSATQKWRVYKDPSGGPAVRCIAVSAQGCAIAWIAAAEAAASLGLPLWRQDPFVIEGLVEPSDAPALAATLISLYADPSPQLSPKPLVQGRLSLMGPLQDPEGQGCAQTPDGKPICELEQLYQHLTGRPLLAFVPRGGALVVAKARPLSEARLAALQGALTQASGGFGGPGWGAWALDEALLGLSLDASPQAAHALAQRLDAWLSKAPNILQSPPDLALSRARARALRHLEATGPDTPWVAAWHWQQGALHHHTDERRARAHYARAALWAHVLSSLKTP